MKKNFRIRDGTIFSFLNEVIDLREVCEFDSIKFLPGDISFANLRWKIAGSNSILSIEFSEIEYFYVKARDPLYPSKYGRYLTIAGFVNIDMFSTGGDFYVEPEQNIDCISFVMNDKSAFLIKAGAANMHRI